MTIFADIARPDQSVCIEDDKTAETILRELNILDQLKKHDALSMPCIGAAYVHDAHIIGILWFRGYAKPEDNGFILHISPRTMTTLNQMTVAIRKTIAQHSAENVPPWIDLEKKNVFHDE